jgi:hypothetical protein
MTSSVKGPGGPGGIAPPSFDAPERTVKGAGSFRDALVEAGAQTSSVAPTDPIARALSEGTIDAEGAVDALVERAIQRGMAQGLTEEGVKALRTHLVSALEHDPALASLVRDLENGRD